MARRSKNRWGKYFINFSPAVSNEAAKEIRQDMRQWALHLSSDKTFDDLARMINPVLRGWINYYGSRYKSALYSTLHHFDYILARWARRKYKKLKGRKRNAEEWLRKIARRQPRSSLIGNSFSRRLDGKSRMNREIHVRIREGPRVRLPWATRLAWERSRGRPLYRFPAS